MAKDEPTHQPMRMVAGHCPTCAAVVVVFNNYEVWPLVQCSVCGWVGATDAINSYVRLETRGVRFVEPWEPQ